MNKIILVLGFSCSLAYAADAPVGRITEMTGAGFISYKGNTHEIRKGDLIYPNSEIVVEHKGRVTYADNFDHKFHVGNSSSIAIKKGGVELRSGDLWLQSLNRTENYKLNTANAIIEFQSGEGIVTYESGTGKTQLMVINGLMKFSNFRVPDLNLSVSEGNFSYVDNNYEEGAPRNPTPVGPQTYKELLGLFNGINPIQKSQFASANTHEKVADHEVKNEASKTDEHNSGAVKSHSETKREIASIKENKFNSKLLDEYKLNLFKNDKKSAVKAKGINVKKVTSTKMKNPLIVHIYGQTNEKVAKVNKTEMRMPASVETPTEGQVEHSLNNNSKIENKDIQINTKTPTKETEKLLEQIKGL